MYHPPTLHSAVYNGSSILFNATFTQIDLTCSREIAIQYLSTSNQSSIDRNCQRLETEDTNLTSTYSCVLNLGATGVEDCSTEHNVSVTLGSATWSNNVALQFPSKDDVTHLALFNTTETTSNSITIQYQLDNKMTCLLQQHGTSAWICYAEQLHCSECSSSICTLSDCQLVDVTRTSKFPVNLTFRDLEANTSYCILAQINSGSETKWINSSLEVSTDEAPPTTQPPAAATTTSTGEEDGVTSSESQQPSNTVVIITVTVVSIVASLIIVPVVIAVICCCTLHRRNRTNDRHKLLHNEEDNQILDGEPIPVGGGPAPSIGDSEHTHLDRLQPYDCMQPYLRDLEEYHNKPDGIEEEVTDLLPEGHHGRKDDSMGEEEVEAEVHRSEAEGKETAYVHTESSDNPSSFSGIVESASGGNGRELNQLASASGCDSQLDATSPLVEMKNLESERDTGYCHDQWDETQPLIPHVERTKQKELKKNGPRTSKHLPPSSVQPEERHRESSDPTSKEIIVQADVVPVGSQSPASSSSGYVEVENEELHEIPTPPTLDELQLVSSLPTLEDIHVPPPAAENFEMLQPPIGNFETHAEMQQPSVAALLQGNHLTSSDGYVQDGSDQTLSLAVCDPTSPVISDNPFPSPILTNGGGSSTKPQGAKSQDRNLSNSNPPPSLSISSSTSPYVETASFNAYNDTAATAHCLDDTHSQSTGSSYLCQDTGEENFNQHQDFPNTHPSEEPQQPPLYVVQRDSLHVSATTHNGGHLPPMDGEDVLFVNEFLESCDDNSSDSGSQSNSVFTDDDVNSRVGDGGQSVSIPTIVHREKSSFSRTRSEVTSGICSTSSDSPEPLHLDFSGSPMSADYVSDPERGQVHSDIAASDSGGCGGGEDESGSETSDTSRPLQCFQSRRQSEGYQSGHTTPVSRTRFDFPPLHNNKQQPPSTLELPLEHTSQQSTDSDPFSHSRTFSSRSECLQSDGSSSGYVSESISSRQTLLSPTSTDIDVTPQVSDGGCVFQLGGLHWSPEHQETSVTLEFEAESENLRPNLPTCTSSDFTPTCTDGVCSSLHCNHSDHNLTTGYVSVSMPSERYDNEAATLSQQHQHEYQNTADMENLHVDFQLHQSMCTVSGTD